MIKRILTTAVLALGLILCIGAVQAQTPTIQLVMLLTVTPEATTDNPEPASLETHIRFAWPPDLGDIEACKAFYQGASVWHPRGELYAMANCVEVTVDPNAPR